jgi:hypothetical protein
MPTVHYAWPEENLAINFSVRIENSKIEVKCDLSHFDRDKHLSMVAMHAYDLAMATIDSLCFFYGLGLRVFIEIFVDVDGKETTLTPRSEEVVGLCTAFNLDPSHTGPDNYEAMIRIVVQERALLLALNDLIVPISQFNLATINCARAIEGLRTAMSQPGSTRDEQWEFMREQLNLTREYLKFVIDLSTEPRHGRRKAPEAGQQSEIIKRAWVIMNRFLEYRKRHSQQLPLTDFPSL